MSKSQRLTIKAHNVTYLQSLALQMGVTDITEVLNYLLLDIKGLNYQFGDKPALTAPTLQTRIGYSFDPASFENAAPMPECDRNYQEQDPIIARFASLIEEF